MTDLTKTIAKLRRLLRAIPDLAEAQKDVQP